MPGIHKNRARLLVIGLNPAWQQVFTLPALRPGEVNRARDLIELASGKGLNAARALARQGHDVSLLQIVAGVRGRRLVESCATQGIRSLHAWATGETRVCTTLLGEDHATEVIGPYALQDAEASTIAAALIGRVPPGEAYDAVVVCGTAPAGLATDLYAELVDRVNSPLLVWDAIAGLTPGMLARITWLKINAAEYAALRPALDAAPARPALLVTDGGAGARLHARNAQARERIATVPRLSQVVNPIGAGDVTTALFTDGLLRGLDAETAATQALAAATASCLTLTPGDWDAATAARFEHEITWRDA